MNVVPQRIDLTIKQGSQYSQTIEFFDANGIPIDFTGCTAAMQVRQMRSGALIVSLSTDADGGLTINEPSGTIAIAMTSEQTATFPVAALTSSIDASAFVYDVIVTFPNDGPYSYAYGVVSVIPAITAFNAPSVTSSTISS